MVEFILSGTHFPRLFYSLFNEISKTYTRDFIIFIYSILSLCNERFERKLNLHFRLIKCFNLQWNDYNLLLSLFFNNLFLIIKCFSLFSCYWIIYIMCTCIELVWVDTLNFFILENNVDDLCHF